MSGSGRSVRQPRRVETTEYAAPFARLVDEFIDFGRSLVDELEPGVDRFVKSLRHGLVTAIGAGVLASMQIVNPLGLTLVFNFAAPEQAPDLAGLATFIVGAAAVDAVALPLAGATADLPGLHIIVFFVLACVSTYLIYGGSRLERLWVWAQVVLLTTYYMVLFEPHAFGWTIGQQYAGTTVAILLLFLINRVFIPSSPGDALKKSLILSISRSRRRLVPLLNGKWLARAADSAIASRLGHHLEQLKAYYRSTPGLNARFEMLTGVLTAERLHDELERLNHALGYGAKIDERSAALLADAARALDDSIGAYSDAIIEQNTSENSADSKLAGDLAQLESALQRLEAKMANAPDASGDAKTLEIGQRLRAVGALLRPESNETPLLPPIKVQARSLEHPYALNRFLTRFTLRHSIALTLAFLMGLIENDPAVHAALWLLMIGGPPSHGATVRKVTVRIIGAVLAGVITVVGIEIASSNFDSVASYMMVIFAGAVLMAYIGAGGGIVSYMGIGATVFLIAFSGVKPRDNVFASLWTVWGIILGMAIRAVVSIVWREHAPRTLVEEFIRPMDGMLSLLPDARGNRPSLPLMQDGAAKILHGLSELLTVAHDARLEGRTAGIDSASLIEALDVIRRMAALAVATALEDRATRTDSRPASDNLMNALSSRLRDWRDFLERNSRARKLSPAPLREMVTRDSRNSADLQIAIAHFVDEAAQTAQSAGCLRMAALLGDLENSFTRISLA